MSDEDFGPEFWLHVASDALRHYVDDGGALVVSESADGIVVLLVGILSDCPELKQEFVDMIPAQVEP